ncbi:Alpha/Beta hydrolase protein [Penicillium taxi]|uniref:Alpha/Beta hydrolase protein n=1 Tax=Penicillium taxi TaxID=168475 RepID=UPI0025456526|nr:Alpha/Beta hydrolase protein [Penicillium taxi]KAJ5888505.1 Alpha/Beta hydrolase protein [Penicillium taxi]
MRRRGKPRFVENPEFRVSDFHYVVDYIQTLPYVDSERIGVLGVCGGGGYAFNATMTDYRLKCCVGIIPANFGRLVRESLGGFHLVGSLEKMAKQRTLEAQEVIVTRPFIALIGAIPGGFGAYHNGNEIYSRSASMEKELLVLPGVSHY